MTKQELPEIPEDDYGFDFNMIPTRNSRDSMIKGGSFNLLRVLNEG